MKATYIDYRETNSFSHSVISYLEQDPKLAPFISHNASLAGFKALLSEKKVTANRLTLVEVLSGQYRNLNNSFISPSVSKNTQLLLNEKTFTVTTGHQLNIFTGPLYFIYKIVTAINLAAQLKIQFPDNNFVPVYWMATEDHDFAEINHTSLNSKQVVWNTDAAGATGRLDTASIAHALKDYQGALGLSENACKLSSIIEKAYRGHATLADATRYLVNELFGGYGLVVLDADDKRLKQQFTPVIKQDITGQNSYRLINESSAQLQAAGFQTQVNVREINFFYLIDGVRERITFEGGIYQVLNTGIRFSTEELEKEICDHPERFSPNVVLRPLYQEIILPNLAYVGGGAELVYWLQLKQNFDFYGVDFPVLILRNSALIADETTEARLTRMSLSYKDLFKDPDELKKDWVLKHTGHKLSLQDKWMEFEHTFGKIRLQAAGIDPTLSASTDAVKARLHKQLLNLEKKLIRAEKRNHSTSLIQIDSIREKMFPAGVLQERTENFGSFYVKYGDKFISELVDKFKPLDFKFTILCC